MRRHTALESTNSMATQNLKSVLENTSIFKDFCSIYCCCSSRYSTEDVLDMQYNIKGLRVRQAAPELLSGQIALNERYDADENILNCIQIFMCNPI